MYAAVRQYEMGAGSVPAFMAAVDDGLAPELRSQPGFVSYQVIASGADEIVSVTIFEDEDGAVRSNEVAAAFVRDRLQAFELNLVSAMSGEVSVHHVADGARSTAAGR